MFRRSSGDSSDVVTKEMYEFKDRGGRDIALRPEGTASVVRAFVQHSPVPPFKAWYAAPMFRYERPQAGRFRQHHQLGVEILGTDDPMADVEVISLLAALVRGPRLVVAATSRQLPRGQDVCSGLSRAAGRLPGRARRGAVRRASLQVGRRTRCGSSTASVPSAAGSPRAHRGCATLLCEDCRRHFADVLGGLDRLAIDYEQDDFLVRGLDYYTRTTFEYGSDVRRGRRRRRPLRRAGRRARRPASVRRRFRRRYRADPARLRCRRASRRRRPATQPGTRRLRRRHDRRRASPSSSPGAARRRVSPSTVPSTGAR